ncbi:oncostatin-M-specific receptor subunit beta-like isoform X2 [Gigantopelta aegis]|uniref:oncostatin-M-specific receptor subunit beta-like isoform X2 n=1 Tax=Gigantopelta aegis TaxID=1735272 RepID=UPI001B88B164|nr:oncostatin-M-specific receptor subunit beta-like isoform X2 [Gigantopelta aegis]
MGLTTFKALKSFLCLVCCFTCPAWAFVFEENGTVRPNNPVVFIGHNLTLYCNLTAVHIHTNSSSMYFVKRFRNTTRSIPRKYTKIVNSRTIRLDYPVTSSANQGTYYCRINRTLDRKPLTLGRQYVMVEYELKPVESIDCRVFNWETMRCTWDLGVNYINMDNILVTLVWARQSQEDCPHPTKTSCTWEGVDGDDDVGKSFIPDLPYYMMINTTLMNQNGKLHTEVKSKTFHVDSRLIVKPAHVENLMVTSQNSTCATLHWKHNKVAYEKVYRLRYRPQWDKDADWMEMSQIKDEHVTVCGLNPFTIYKFWVACLPIPSGDDMPDGFWSGWKKIESQTAENKPGKAPQISPGGFTEETCDDFEGCRKVTLFWQPVDERHRNGHILGYKVELLPTDKEDKKTFFINSEFKTSATLQLLSGADYQVWLYARNSMGYSPTNSSLSIPRSERKPRGPGYLLVESSSHSKNPRFTLNWLPPHSEEMNYDFNLQSLGYTLYWCQRSHLPLVCEDQIDWISLPVSQTSYEYVSSDEVSGNGHLFGISREVISETGRTVSSGITWSPCTYIKGAKPEKPPKNFHISGIKDDRALKIEWQPFDCFESLGYVTHYVIHYCKADVTGECNDPVQNVSVENTETSYILRDLEPDVFYRITAEAVARAGPGPESQPLKGKVTDNDLGRNTGAIMGIVVGIVFFVILLAFSGIVIFKKCVRVKKNFYYHVSYPHSIKSLPLLPQGSNPSDDVKYEPIGTKANNNSSNNNNNNNNRE